jgi:ArsR family transcriptional regulator, cadmium/lead-responsive transcriptional repressor
LAVARPKVHRADNSRFPEFSDGCTIGTVTTVAPTLDTLERFGTALADPTRRRILVQLLDGPAYPGDFAEALGSGRSNISNHLACLRGCGLVRTERQGRQIRYELASPRLAHALADLVDLDLDVDADHRVHRHG